MWITLLFPPDKWVVYFSEIKDNHIKHSNSISCACPLFIVASNSLIQTPCKNSSCTEAGKRGLHSELQHPALLTTLVCPLVSVGVTSEKGICSTQISTFACWLGQSPRRQKIHLKFKHLNLKKKLQLCLFMSQIRTVCNAA